jgi:ribosomal protein S18 acetylase RimI-like enzyme
MKKKDIGSFIECENKIWESLKGYLPKEFIERNLSWINREGRENAWERVIDDPNWIPLVAVENRQIIGLALGRVDWSKLSTLGFIGVDTQFRRKGIARKLLTKFIDESRNRNAAKVTLETSPTLKPAIKLYTDMEFIPEGFLKQHRLGVDIIVYSLDL